MACVWRKGAVCKVVGNVVMNYQSLPAGLSLDHKISFANICDVCLNLLLIWELDVLN